MVKQLIMLIILGIFCANLATAADCPVPGSGTPSGMLTCDRGEEKNYGWNVGRVLKGFGSFFTGEAVQNYLRICDCRPSDSITLNYNDGMALDQTATLKDGESSTFGISRITVKKVADKLCIYETSFFSSLTGLIISSVMAMPPIGCKYIDAQPLTPQPVIETNYMGGSCFDATKRHSKSPWFSLSGAAVECMNETLEKVFYKEGNASIFSAFKSMMKKTVFLLLTIYVMISGFQILLGQEAAVKKGEIMSMIFKVILVLYFSVGLKQTDGSYRDGIQDYALPTFKAVSVSFSNYILNASGKGNLCKFDISSYPKEHQGLAIWDSLDCKIAYYFSMMSPHGLLINSATAMADSTVDAVGKEKGIASFLGILSLIAGAIISFPLGLLLFVMLLLIFFFILSTVVYFVHHFILCLIALTFALFLAPLFIPMVLFNQTKNYFDSWLRQVSSYALQPVVIAAFLALMLTVYDQAIYGSCQFEPQGNNEPGHYALTAGSFKDPNCTGSMGFLMGRFKVDYVKNAASTFFENYGLALANAAKMAFLFSFLFYYFAGMVSNFAADVTGGASVGDLGSNAHGITDLAGNMGMRAVNATIARFRRRPRGGVAPNAPAAPVAARAGAAAPAAPAAPVAPNNNQNGINAAVRNNAGGNNA